MTVADRPLYQGLPVPYVAAWTAETTGAWNPRLLQSWLGIRWLNTNRPGKGTPIFGQTNSHRQRECMRRGRCQVCGDKGATTFVVPDDDTWHRPLWERGLVINAPVHQACLDESLRLCPHLAATPPFTVVTNPAEIRWVCCSATSPDGKLTTVVPLQKAKDEQWIGRELVVQLRGYGRTV